MNDLLELLIYFGTSYILTFIVYYFLLNRKKTKTKLNADMEINYIINRHKLNPAKINMKRLKWVLNIVNPFIIALTFLVVISIKSFVLGIMVGFVIMLILIYSIYEIIGRYLKRKEKKYV